MSNENWTPGPWQRSPSQGSGGSFIEHIDQEYVGHMVAFVHASHGMFDAPVATERDVANAHLVAAAPELYEALDQAVTSMRDSGYPASNSAVKAAKAALSKTRGESWAMTNGIRLRRING